MEKKMQVEVFENAVVVIRPDTSAIVVTENDNITLGVNVVTAIVKHLPIINDYQTTLKAKDNAIEDLRCELKAVNEKCNALRKELEVTGGAKVIKTGVVARVVKSMVKDVDDNLICNCGKEHRARAVADALINGKVDIDTVKMLYPSEGVDANIVP